LNLQVPLTVDSKRVQRNSLLFAQQMYLALIFLKSNFIEQGIDSPGSVKISFIWECSCFAVIKLPFYVKVLCLQYCLITNFKKSQVLFWFCDFLFV